MSCDKKPSLNGPFRFIKQQPHSRKRAKDQKAILCHFFCNLTPTLIWEGNNSCWATYSIQLAGAVFLHVLHLIWSNVANICYALADKGWHGMSNMPDNQIFHNRYSHFTDERGPWSSLGPYVAVDFNAFNMMNRASLYIYMCVCVCVCVCGVCVPYVAKDIWKRSRHWETGCWLIQSIN